MASDQEERQQFCLTDVYEEESLKAFVEANKPGSKSYLAFERGGTLFFKSDITDELDEKFGNIRSEIIIE